MNADVIERCNCPDGLSYIIVILLALAQRLKEQESLLSKLTGETVKVQEVSGTTISQMLTRSNPFKTKCDEPCVLCESTSGRQDCTRRGILYSLECTRCLELVEQQEAAKKGAKEAKKKQDDKEEPKAEQKALRSVYIGESSRCAKLRLQTEHMKQYEALDPDCHMTKHFHECHQGEERPKFKARILKYFNQAYLRQLGEATYIWRLSRQNGVNIRILNSKGMYNRCSLERLQIIDSVTEGQGSEPRKENERKDVKKLVEDSSLTRSPIPSESILNNSSKGKKKSKMKTKTDGHQAKSADIKQYFHRIS